MMAELSLDLPDMAWHLRGLLRQVPSGRVTTYGALATALGDPVAARWVGHFLLHHDHDPLCPCHRAVRELLSGHPLPEPIFWADRLSRAEAKRAVGRKRRS